MASLLPRHPAIPPPRHSATLTPNTKTKCAAAFGILLLLALTYGGVILSWEYDYNVGRGTPCDKPLNEAVLGYAIMFFAFVLVNVVTLLNRRLWQTWVPYLAGLLFVYIHVWVVLTNVWVWKSVTCKDSSRGVRRAPWFDSIYETSRSLVIAFDALEAVFWLSFFAYAAWFERNYRRLRQKEDKISRFEAFREFHPNAHRVVAYGPGAPAPSAGDDPRVDYENI